jgi:hypothetical protein
MKHSARHRLPVTRGASVRALLALLPRPRKVSALGPLAVVLCTASLVTVSVPAYAYVPGGQTYAALLAPAAVESPQSVNVSVMAAGPVVSRDWFTVVTRAQAKSDLAKVASAALAPIRVLGDDYPWPASVPVQDGGGLSPLGYYNRECVDFVAWRLNRDAGTPNAPFTYVWSNLTETGGDARDRAKAWQYHGWQISQQPLAGAVAWWSSNHVAYVQAVNKDGSVVLEEYNIGGRHAYSTRTIPAKKVEKFLYPPTDMPVRTKGDTGLPPAVGVTDLRSP